MITQLIIFNICHFLGDYTHLSTKWMLDAKRFGKPTLPILAHASVHGFLMSIPLFYLLGWCPLFANLVLFQVGTHFLIDVLKGKINVWFPRVANPISKIHWYIFGLDQLAHQIVILIMIYCLNYAK